MTLQILILDDEENIRKILTAMLCAEGYETVTASTISEAKDLIRKGSIQVILSDLRLVRESGLTLLRWVRESQFSIPVIILTAHGTIDSAVDAMKQGAFDFLSKPFDRKELINVLKKAALSFKFQSLQLDDAQMSADGLPMIGQTEKMEKIYALIAKVAGHDSTILIQGESGTGKELIAQALHDKSPRSKGPYIKINCAAIPQTLMESELFGYERGAFTGAVNSKPGRFELADGGTLFLDEIGEMCTEMQVKLLRVLQDKSFERVGGIRTLKVNVRLVTATNKKLEEEVKHGRFRQDLYYRLNVVPIDLPPLRERPEDIPRLLKYFLQKFSLKMSKAIPSVSSETLELLQQFPWPGNIRQLENVVERVMVLTEGGVVTPDQLPDVILDFEEQKFLEKHPVSGASLKDIVKDATRRIEKRAIEEALLETVQNVTQAARKLEISRKGLQLKMKELGLR